jgi:hypothetical protein
MFGIQGQLEDPYRTDWKLVYVDHENDILLVGDDPWEYVPTSVSFISSVHPYHGVPLTCSASDVLKILPRPGSL